ncbi:MAG: alanine--tRNA ligase-related protein [bacterium]
MGEHYHELRERRDIIEKICSIEEERFRSTIEQGEALLNEEITRLNTAGDNMISGETAFKLYDTYGYPVELTREIAEDRGLIVDGAGFERLMEEQKSQSQGSQKGSAIVGFRQSNRRGSGTREQAGIRNGARRSLSDTRSLNWQPW